MNFQRCCLLVADRPDVLEALSDPNGLFTVFAPNNDAFGDVLSENPDLNEDQVNEILFYHVLAGASVLSGRSGRNSNS
jgi:uncharacterized surface protein with fasciclin (FAS1) repeats